MFFQSFLGVFTIDPNNSTVFDPALSLQIYTQSDAYVLPGVYIGNAATNPTAENPFAIKPITPSITPLSGSYLPTINVKTTFSSFEPWTIDFQSSETVAWADNCTQSLLNNNTVFCTEYPTLVPCEFNLGLADDTKLIVGSFNNLTFSGYVTNGNVVLQEVCFENYTFCKVVRVYAVTQIIANNWFDGV